ncbi:MAG: hypothetical protein GC151_03305 [Betaproteobacteria bacterium]|nr:hypothetical protein [Betaproteobacteria bacterium]
MAGNHDNAVHTTLSIAERRARSAVTRLATFPDAWNIALAGASGSAPVTILDGPGVDERYAATQGASTTAILTDVLGSTVALVGSAGGVVGNFIYEPYGQATQSGSADSIFRFTGREDDGTGLMYYRARYYNPRMSRFISEDPIGLAGGYNVYAYVGGNPTGATDPTGLWSVTFGGYAGIGGTVIFGSDAATGGGFMTVNVGVGAGVGVSYNPFGGRPGSEEGQADSGGVGAGVFGSATFNARPFQGAIAGHRGANLPITGRPYPVAPYAEAGPSFSVGNSWGINANAAIGIAFTIFGRRCPTHSPYGAR